MWENNEPQKGSNISENNGTEKISLPKNDSLEPTFNCYYPLSTLHILESKIKIYFIKFHVHTIYVLSNYYLLIM